MPDKDLSTVSKRRTRMDRLDYLMICTLGVLRSRGDERVPRLVLETFNPNNYDPSIYDEANRMTTEMFGYASFFSTMYDGLEPLSSVKLLTLQETAIAERSDISHAEKIRAIRPLREKRLARYSARMGWDAAQGDVPEVTVSEQTFEQRVSDADAILARGMGISLD